MTIKIHFPRTTASLTMKFVSKLLLYPPAQAPARIFIQRGDEDEAVAIACLCLVENYHKFDVSNAGCLWYACGYIANALNRHLRLERNANTRCLYSVAHIPDDAAIDDKLLDLPCHRRTDNHVDQLRELNLPPDQVNFLREIAYSGVREVAKTSGLKTTCVAMRKNRLVNELKQQHANLRT